MRLEAIDITLRSVETSSICGTVPIVGSFASLSLQKRSWIHDAEKDAAEAVSILASSAYVALRLGVLARPTVFVAVEPPADVLLHTPFDGDTIFCVSTGQLKGECLEVGMLASMVVFEAERRGVRHAKSAWGFPGLKDGNQ